MKILYLSTARMPTEKAHGLQMVKTLEALGNRAEVTFFYPSRKNIFEKSIFDFYNLDKKFNVRELLNPFIFLEKKVESVYFSLLRAYLWCALTVIGVFKKNDAVLTREIVVAYVLSLFGKKVIFEDHEPKRSFRWLYCHMVRKIKKKIIVAANMAAIYEKCGVDETTFTFIPNGVDLKEFEREKRDEDWLRKKINVSVQKKVVLYVGHFYKWKGVYTLLEAAPIIRGDVLLLGGTEIDTEKMKKYINGKDIKNVSLHSFVEHGEAVKFMKSADVLVLPNTSLEERSREYTTPIKMFEYMASGVPIVASDIPSFSNYLKHNRNAILVKPDDVIELVNAINYALKNDVNSLSDKAKQDVLAYTWQSRADKIIDFIKT